MDKKENAFSVDRAEDSPGFLLWQVTTMWQRGIKKALDEIDITHPQFVILASLLWLARNQQPVMQIDLSNHSQIDPMTTSQVIRILEKKLLIVREVHPEDTRAKAIKLTDQGSQLTRKAIKIIEQFDNSFFLCLDDRTQHFNKLMIELLSTNTKSK